MFVMNRWESLGTLVIFAILFLYLKYNKSNVNWGSSTDANRYRKALLGLIKLTRQSEHVKNYRPQLLVLSGNPIARQALVDFAHSITKGTNLLVCGHVIPYTSCVAATECTRQLNNKYTNWLHEQKLKAFYCGVAHTSLREGVQMLMQAVGLGKMQPNILFIGYLNHFWAIMKEDPKAFNEYTGVIQDAFEANLSLCICRNGDQGLDHSALFPDSDESLLAQLPNTMIAESALHDDKSRGVARRLTRPKAVPTSNAAMLIDAPSGFTKLTQSLNRNAPDTLKASNFARHIAMGKNLRYRTRFTPGYVDVWVMYDDGGLTLLLAYLLTSKPSFLENGKLRFFTICSENANADDVRNQLTHTLKKFRIAHHDVVVIVETDRELYQETTDEFEQLVSEINDNPSTPRLSSELLDKCHHRTQSILRQREYLFEHSSASNFVIITLPIASAEIVQGPLYMLWLHLLSEELPPTLFVRGNNTSVLTFYS